MRTAATLVSLLGAATLAASGLAQTTGPTAFEGVRVISGTGAAPIENATVVVDGARIVAVGPAASVSVPAKARRVNLAGKTVMPAIVDTHTHLSTTRDALTNDLRRRAFYGVSAAMSLGTDEGDVALSMRSQTTPDMARVFTAGRGITRPEKGRTTVPYWIDTEAEGRKAVQELAARKVDIVKIWVDDRNGAYMKLTPALYGAIIDEAHKHGLRVTAHIVTLEDAKGLLRAGIDAFAHGIRDRDLDDEVVTLFRERPNVVLVPNMPDRGVRVDLGWLKDSVPSAEWDKLEAGNTDRPPLQTAWAIQARNLAKLSAAGVRVALGTDGNTPYAAHVEMADMVAAGITPMQVIVAATRNSAAFVRMTDTGTIEAGRSADLLVLDANPLDDITNTRRIHAVYLRGVEVNRAPFRVAAASR